MDRIFVHPGNRRIVAGILGITVLLAAGVALHAWWLHPEDRIYRIGADYSPPYYYVHDDGTVEGLAVDVLNEAAQQTNIRLEWVTTHLGVDTAFEQKLVDIWPAIAATPKRSRLYHLTEPWLKNNYCLIELDHPPKGGAGLPVVAGRPGETLRTLANRYLPPHRFLQVPTRTDSLQAVCRGEADSAFLEARFLDSALLNRPAGCETQPLRVRTVEGALSELRIMSMPGSAKAADKLRKAISGMAESGTLVKIVEKWSTIATADAGSIYALKEIEERNHTLVYASVCAVIFVAILLWQVNRARQAERRALEAQKKAECADAAKSEFLANMSHEIRTPLNGVIGLTNLVLDGPLDESKRPDLEIIQESAGSLLRIISDVLDFSKLEAGKFKLESTPFDLKDLLDSVVELFAHQAAAAGVTVLVDYPEHLPQRFNGDAMRIRQIMLNLTSNAVKFTLRGRIIVSAACVDGLIRLSVRDTGIGIPRDVLSRLFSKFTQADASTTRQYGGTGLGLAISRHLAELMAGTIGADSEPGRGSTFWVQLPLEPAPLWEQPIPNASVATSCLPAEGQRVLVAEDNVVNRELLARILRKRGCVVDLASNGVEAVKLSEQNCYAAIFMDCQMPVMDGYDATARIRARERLDGSHTPIIAVTAHVLTGESERCRAAGMDHYMSKPIQISELHQCLATYCSTSHTASSASSPEAI